MQKRFVITYFLIFSILLVAMTLSRHSTDTIRGKAAEVFAPFWTTLLSTKHFFIHPMQPSPFTELSVEEEKQNLQSENQLLLNELIYLQQILKQQVQFSEQIDLISTALPEKRKQLNESSAKSAERLLKQITLSLKGIPARVIFRTLDTWNSSLWINVGESTNQLHQVSIVAKNSPVVVGRAIVGLIDYVGEHQSHVRLLSDPNLTPSVRAARGGEQELLTYQSIEEVLDQINQNKFDSLSSMEQNQMTMLLQKARSDLKPLNESNYLAKGELTGSPSLSRGRHTFTLNGTGFNYDFEDEEGEAHDLRNGSILQGGSNTSVPILEVNDILVTTGMDGIFPPGFQVAKVDKIELLKEGDYYYNIQAKPIVSPLQNLNLVFVLPPLKE
jgi:cell shape-determining protein MreC